MKLKVCGMKFSKNIDEVGRLQPDFMGFIFWPKTKRFFSERKIILPKNIKKVGVFVNQDLEFIKYKVKEFNLDYVQFVSDLIEPSLPKKIIKNPDNGSNADRVNVKLAPKFSIISPPPMPPIAPPTP